MRALASIALAALAAVALSGCTVENSPEGQSMEQQGAGHVSVAYNGAATGSDSKSLDCGASARIQTEANIGSGSLEVRVRDGSGRTVHDHDVEGPGQATDSRTLSGAAGSWTLDVKRVSSGSMFGGGWSGQYAIHLRC